MADVELRGNHALVRDPTSSASFDTLQTNQGETGASLFKFHKTLKGSDDMPWIPIQPIRLDLPTMHLSTSEAASFA